MILEFWLWNLGWCEISDNPSQVSFKWKIYLNLKVITNLVGILVIVQNYLPN